MNHLKTYSKIAVLIHQDLHKQHTQKKRDKLEFDALGLLMGIGALSNIDGLTNEQIYIK